ncbi:MAG: peroxiredoxin [Amylibacter sp.]|jgi:peroxiredoxin Q/BCP|tara:strand:- start:323 stop:793 length:471 start_codon:yes stop_codon:yes gene_type:complete
MPIIGKNVQNLKITHKNNKIFMFSDLFGKYVVLYFYPRDDTPGCTKEAKDFTELKPEFDKLNTIIIGVSTDTLEAHNKFIFKHNLNLELLSDTNKTLCEFFDVWVEKNMYGKKYMGIERSTFLINPTGEILHEWRKVKVAGHAKILLESIKKQNLS